MGFRLSVLDQSPIPEGGSAGEALRNSIDLAVLSEQLGYYRYWVAEHHGTPALACNSPEVLIGPIASATSRIRVGSGGIMLPHYSPLKVAENFRMLSGLYPGRIDIGVGRAAGTSPNVTLMLQRDRQHTPPDDFLEQFDELLGYIYGDRAVIRPLKQLSTVPGIDAEPWLLGSSEQSAIWAAELGLPYVFADFINPRGAEIARYYRDHFQPSEHLKQPKLAVAVWAICAETDEEAVRLSASAKMMLAMMFRGRMIAVPPVETALAFLAGEERAGLPVLPGRRILNGAPATVRTQLDAVVAEYGAEEALVVNILYDHQARRRSYELLADEYQLAAGGGHTVHRVPDELHQTV